MKPGCRPDLPHMAQKGCTGAAWNPPLGPTWFVVLALLTVCRPLPTEAAILWSASGPVLVGTHTKSPSRS